MNEKNRPLTDEAFVRVAILENPIEAQVIEPVLEAENIPHLLRTYHDTAYDGLFQTQKGWGEIRAPQSWRDKILEILDDVRAEDAGVIAEDDEP
ncbi:hypothetical protein DENIS_0491 [Desulfonema ishimotonii]|uniref:DUF2007 domain-containing protein n=1 Tax=Desulfonema ishimotonii TaxID=45657 RepID=A0A401FRF3_9BACT|nr:hypothetical protein [Desulfonema ishimotonii]GBC59552.1 hypothetical protein DENIS_0491 [Desulfonema ishimotonii]